MWLAIGVGLAVARGLSGAERLDEQRALLEAQELHALHAHGLAAIACVHPQRDALDALVEPMREAEAAIGAAEDRRARRAAESRFLAVRAEADGVVSDSGACLDALDQGSGAVRVEVQRRSRR